jgi:hypothetical protein
MSLTVLHSCTVFQKAGHCIHAPSIHHHPETHMAPDPTQWCEHRAQMSSFGQLEITSRGLISLASATYAGLCHSECLDF